MRRACLFLALLCAAALPATAHAGAYTTVSCNDPDTHQSTGLSGLPPGWGFSEYQPGSGNWRTFAACTHWAADHGFGFQTNPIGGRVPWPQWGRISFNPPADTSVAGVRVARELRRPNPSPFVVPMLASSPADWCHTYWSACTVGDITNPSDPANLAELGGSAWFELYCDGGVGCPRDGWAAWQVSGARITLRDDYAPAFAGTPSGFPAVTVSGSDRGGGLLRAEVLAGGEVIGSASFDSGGRCDTSFHTDLVPCPLTAARVVTSDTTRVPDGTYAISARLTDVAGNATTYALGTRTIDNYPDPGAPSVASRSAWLNAQQASVYAVAIAPPAGAQVAGYSVTYDGSDPDATVDVGADDRGQALYGPPPGGWPDGRVTIRVRTVAKSGEVSADVARVAIRVDSAAPELIVAGGGNASDWRPPPVTVTLGARDSGSGMGAAGDGEPVESGGYVAYSVDGQPLRKVAGDEAMVAVSGLGAHTITFRAYDAAGNVSVDRTVPFVVGRPQSGLAGPSFGFWDRSANPETTFSAAASFGSACPAELTLTPARDTYLDEAQPDATFASATGLVVRSAQGANARALLAFGLPAAGGCGIASAELRIHAGTATSGRSLRVYRAAGSWDGDSTWATRPGVVGLPATAASGPGWLSFDVTEQVRGIYAHGDDGLMLRDATEASAQPAGQVYGASEGVPAERPQLIVRFE